jgi:MFS family permease
MEAYEYVLMAGKFVFPGYLMSRATIGVANTMLTVSLGWHLYEETGDAWSLALVGLMQILPVYLFFFVSGYVIDNVPRRLVVRACALLESLAIFGIAYVFHEDQLELAWLYCFIFIHGIGRAFHGPALHAIIPSLVNRSFLDRAIALSSTVWNVAGVIGPVVAGILILWIDRLIYPFIALITLSTLLGYLALPIMRMKASNNRRLDEILAGMKYVRGHSIILGGLTIDLLMVGFGSVLVLLPIYAADILKVGPDELGLLRAMPALGSIRVGIYIATRRTEMNHSGKKLFWALILFALSVLAFSVSNILWISLVALFMYGAADMVSVNIRMGMVQAATPENLRGRVSAVNMLFIQTSNEAGDFRGGAFAASFGVVQTAIIGALLGFGFLFWTRWKFPQLFMLSRISELSVKDSGSPKDLGND